MRTLRSNRHFHNLALSIVCLLSAPLWAAGPDAPGVPNFHQVNDHVYRGGQPLDEGFKSLAKLGVKTVIDLRREGEDDEHSISEESEAVTAAGLRYLNVPMKGMVAPTEEQMSKIRPLLNSGEPVFIHCKKGKDRTGTVIAAYRITHDHWESHKALDEAKDIGMSWTQMGMKHYILNLQP